MAKTIKVRETYIPGAVTAFAGPTAPTGWLMCDGSPISRTTYATLFAAIGTTHGQGDGSTTFNLPDYRGRFLRGVANGQSTDPDRAARTAMASGGNTGDNVGSVQPGALGAHQHDVGVDSSGAGTAPSATNGGGFIRGQNLLLGRTATPNGTGVEINTRNNPGGNETRPVNANVFYIIKV